MLFKPSHAPTNPLMRLAKGAVGCTAFIAAMLLAIQASAAQISLTWNASSTTSVTGYNLYARASSGSYTTANNVGNTLSYTVSTLPSGAAIAAGQTYCFAVTAYNAARTESSPSNEVCGAAPAATSGSTTPGSTSGTSGTSLATLWPNSAIPANVAVGDSTALTVGVKFTSTTNGSVLGIRFYKGPGNSGRHLGSLWTATGTPLAGAYFTNETATGWQEVRFSSPVAITANTVYVASYFAPNGHISWDNGYFSSSTYTSGPLKALRSTSSSPNGVYAIGSNPAFPSRGDYPANFWVDVIFRPAS